MKTNFHIWQNNRNIYYKFLQHNSLEQLNKIPEGFNNNLIWNIGHVIVVQQRLVYANSGLPMNVSDDLFQAYKPGSKPEGDVPKETVDFFKELLISPIDQTIEDFENGRFTDYNEFTTSKGFHLASVEDAITFNNYHEALHLGTMVSLLKFLQ
tara:strand:+ start:268 stop:726 length:459 start_codon:yes stop_codon:yes gene_type:complete